MKIFRSALVAFAIASGLATLPAGADVAVKVKITFSTPPATSLVVLGSFTPSATSTSGHTLGNGITATINPAASTVCTMATDGTYTVTFTSVGQCLITYVDAPTSLTRQGLAHQVLKIQAVTTGAPTFSGLANVGNTLTGSIGTWDSACTSFTYNWSADGVAVTSNLVPNSDGTIDPYTVPSTLLNKHLRLRVIGSCLINNVPTPISRVSRVSLVRWALRIVTSQPSISGNPVNGHVLTATVTNWTPGVQLSYQWYVAGNAIVGATSQTYTTTLADKGRHIRVQVGASKLGYRSVMRYSKLFLVK